MPKPHSVNWTQDEPQRLYRLLGLPDDGGPLYRPDGIPCFFDGKLGDKPNKAPGSKGSLRWNGNVLKRRALVLDWDIGTTNEVCAFLRGEGQAPPTSSEPAYQSARALQEVNHRVLPVPDAIVLTRGFGTGVHAYWVLPGGETDMALYAHMARLAAAGTGADVAAGVKPCSVMRRPCLPYERGGKTHTDRKGWLWINPKPEKLTKEELYEAINELIQPEQEEEDDSGPRKSSRGRMTYTREQVDAALAVHEVRRKKGKGRDGNYPTYLRTAFSLTDAYLQLGLTRADATSALLAHSPDATEEEQADIRKLVRDFREPTSDSDTTIRYPTLFEIAKQRGATVAVKPVAVAAEPVEGAAEAVVTNSVEFLAKYGKRFRRGAGSERQWWVWSGRYWWCAWNNDSAHALIVRLADGDGWAMKKSHEHVELAKWLRPRIQAFDGDDQSAASIVPFNDCCYDLKQGKAVPHRLEHFNTWCLPHNFTNNKECPKTLAFLRERFPDEEDYQLFLCFCWAALTGHQPKAFLELIGESNTGKTTAANLIDAMVGAGSTVSGSLNRLEDRGDGSRFEAIRYRTARVARMNECGDYKGPLDQIKAFTGGDAIRAEGKGSNAFESFVFSGIVVMVGNSAVTCRDPAVAKRRRTILMNEVVETDNQRVILAFKGGAWRGEIAEELPRFIRYLLDLEEVIPAPDVLLEKAGTASQNRSAKAVMEADDLVVPWLMSRCCVSVDHEQGETVMDLYDNYKTWHERFRPDRKILAKNVFSSQCRHAVGLALNGENYPLAPGKHRTMKASFVLRLYFSGETRIDRRCFSDIW